MTWQPRYSVILDRRDDLVLCERVDSCTGEGSVIAPRWYTVRIEDDKPDWASVRYHRLLNQGERRLGITQWVHPDAR